MSTHTSAEGMPQGRTSVMANGDTTFVDYDNLHPENETVAALTGASSGALGGALVSSLGLMLRNDGQALIPRMGLITTGIVAVSAIIGGVTNVLRAKTHNQWSKDVLQSINNKNHTPANER